MTSAVLVVVAAGMLGSVQDQLGARPTPTPLTVQSAIGTMKRLAAAVPADRPGLPDQERALHQQRKQRLDELVTYIEKADQVMQVGQWSQNDYFNVIQAVRDAVSVGVELSILPEEALVWQRAGLDLALAQYRVVNGRVSAGIDSPQALNQARAQVELFRANYVRARAQCLPSVR